MPKLTYLDLETGTRYEYFSHYHVITFIDNIPVLSKGYFLDHDSAEQYAQGVRHTIALAEQIAAKLGAFNVLLTATCSSAFCNLPPLKCKATPAHYEIQNTPTSLESVSLYTSDR